MDEKDARRDERRLVVEHILEKCRKNPTENEQRAINVSYYLDLAYEFNRGEHDLGRLGDAAIGWDAALYRETQDLQKTVGEYLEKIWNEPAETPSNPLGGERS